MATPGQPSGVPARWRWPAVVANGANVLVTLVIARELSTRNYGAYNQLIALFFVLSMPGSALVVGVVRRVTQWQRLGEQDRIAVWSARIRRIALFAVLGILVVGLIIRGPIARELSLPGPGGIAEVLTAGAAWCLLCIDRGLLQASRLYTPLGVNLLTEGLLRAFLTVGFVVAGAGPAGAAAALLVGILVADIHARWELHRRRAIILEPAGDAAKASSEGSVSSHSLAADVGTALIALGLIGLLQNLDVLVLGRQAPGNSGAYAAISVASKALVFGAIVLTGYLLPEVASRRQLGQHALHQLGGTLALLAVPAGILVLLGAIAPHTVLKIAFGERLTGAASALLPARAGHDVSRRDGAVHLLPARGRPTPRRHRARRSDGSCHPIVDRGKRFRDPHRRGKPRRPGRPRRSQRVAGAAVRASVLRARCAPRDGVA